MIERIAIGFIAGIAFIATSKILNGDYGFFDSLWPALAGICAALYPMMDAQAKIHADKIEDGKYPTHWSALILRIAVAVALACLYHAYYFILPKVIDLVLFSAGWIGIVFNFRLNKYRGLAPFYVGLPDKKKDGWQEKIFRRWKYGGQLLFVLEVIWMIVWGYAYLL